MAETTTSAPQGLIHHPLASQGRKLEADTDHLIARTGAGGMLLIHVPPGDYPYEVHGLAEFLICLTGHLMVETDTGESLRAEAGEMIEVSAGVSHRFGAASDAVILTYAQKSPE